KLSDKYLGSLRFLIRYKWVSVAGLAVVMLVTGVLVKTTPSGFIPSEDQGFIAISLSMPVGASLDRTTTVIKELESKLDNMESKKTLMGLSGFNILTQSSSPSMGVSFILLKPT